MRIFRLRGLVDRFRRRSGALSVGGEEVVRASSGASAPGRATPGRAASARAPGGAGGTGAADMVNVSGADATAGPGADGTVGTGPAVIDLDADASEHGLHAITRATDAWFAHELAALEHHAREEAAAWAAAGLPRLEVADEALAVEVALERRCAELFRRWAERVRTRIEDAVHDALRSAAGDLLAMRIHLAALRRTLRDTAEAEIALDRARWTAREDRPTLAYGFPRFLSRRGFWALIALLMAVDLVTNIPIFHELVPHEAGEALLWEDLTARSERYGVWAGAYRVGARLLYAPDITLLALGVIAFLVFSAHVFGESARRLSALREEDLPAARAGIRAHRRQWFFPGVVGILAAGAVITFLFVARERIEQAARERHGEAAAQVTRLEQALAQARGSGDLDAIAAAESQLPAARAVLADRERKLEYASGIAAMNGPILLLNLVLALAAALASYLVKQDRITDGRVADPRVIALEERVEALRARAGDERDAFRDACGRVIASLTHAQRLVDARPLRGWEAKADRLRGVVSLFRAENARLRGIDPVNIAAFRREPVVALVAADADAPLPVPDVLLRCQAELERLEAELAALDAPPREGTALEAA
ncbi:MAG TPA: hypothetical protein VF188_11465 [Longimicrobiales bacterium]